jgi:hypothetical protein
MNMIKVIDGQPVRYTIADLKRDNPRVSFPASVAENDSALAEYGVYRVQPVEPPAYDPMTQRLVEGDPVEASPGVWWQSWSVEDYTEAEIAVQQRAADIEETTRPENLTSALEVLTRSLVDTATLDSLADEDLDAVAVLFKPWLVGEEYAVDAIRKYDGVLWKCIQAHTSQADWAPPVVPALWVRYREPAPGPQEWIAGEQVSVGDVRYYPTISDTAYRAIQAHTTQAGWEPSNVPAFWEAQG